MVVVRWESGCEDFNDIESARVFAKFMLEFEIDEVEIYDMVADKFITI